MLSVRTNTVLGVCTNKGEVLVSLQPINAAPLHTGKYPSGRQRLGLVCI